MKNVSHNFWRNAIFNSVNFSDEIMKVSHVNFDRFVIFKQSFKICFFCLGIRFLRHIHVNSLFYYSDLCYDTSTLMGNNWIVINVFKRILFLLKLIWLAIPCNAWSFWLVLLHRIVMWSSNDKLLSIVTLKSFALMELSIANPFIFIVTGL